MLGPSVRDHAKYLNEIRDIRYSPSSQFSCGILFPQKMAETEISSGEEENIDSDEYEPLDLEFGSANDKKVAERGSCKGPSVSIQ